MADFSIEQQYANKTFPLILDPSAGLVGLQAKKTSLYSF